MKNTSGEMFKALEAMGGLSSLPGFAPPTDHPENPAMAAWASGNAVAQSEAVLPQLTQAREAAAEMRGDNDPAPVTHGSMAKSELVGYAATAAIGLLFGPTAGLATGALMTGKSAFDWATKSPVADTLGAMTEVEREHRDPPRMSFDSDGGDVMSQKSSKGVDLMAALTESKSDLKANPDLDGFIRDMDRAVIAQKTQQTLHADYLARMAPEGFRDYRPDPAFQYGLAA